MVKNDSEKFKYTRVRIIATSCLGNILEWYDFGLFSIFSALFGEIFFPNSNPRTAIIATFGIFAIGFLCRPLGALLFGYLGDKFGRAKTLRWSILMIALPTFLIGLLPTYDQIGITAPILLTIIRMWQGISIGGEYSGNLIYLAEFAPVNQRGLIAALASTGANIGILLATLVGLFFTTLVSPLTLKLWCFRIPYILSGVFGLLIYYGRSAMPETKTYVHLKMKRLIKKNPIASLFKDSRPDLLRTLGMVCMGTTLYFFTFVYLPMFFDQNLFYSTAKISKWMTLFIFCMIFLAPLAGLLSDYIGRKKILLFNSALAALVIIPSFLVLQKNSFLVFPILLLLTLISSIEQGTTAVSIVESFPAATRYTGLAFGYNLGNGLLGGTVPFICATLYVIHPAAPAFYIALCAAITFFVILFFYRETRGNNLFK